MSEKSENASGEKETKLCATYKKGKSKEVAL